MTRRRRHRRRRRPGRHRLAAIVVGMLLLGAGSVLWSQSPESEQGDRTERVDTSKTIYPEGTSAIIFSHAAHESTDCTSCHGAASTSERASQVLMPSMATCASCHADQAKPALQDCSGCHRDYEVTVDAPIETPEDWRRVRPAPMDVARPQANLRFDHRGHVARAAKRAGADASAVCTSCHAPDSTKHPTMPSMESCQSCHNGSVADDACSTCHMTAGTGRLDTTFTDPSTGQTRRLMPTNHSVAWIERHAEVARSAGDECASCHTEDDCATCHQAEVAGAFSVHPPNFELIHMADARANPGNCADCHKAETFCAGCHARTDVRAEPPNDPPARVDFHPPGWLDASMPNNHGVAARQDISQCASCHQEQDCVTCHRGINPHPPEFSLNCR
ncbi:MAG: cytochrome c3 family protein, partial [Myxococcota bacterium]